MSLLFSFSAFGKEGLRQQILAELKSHNSASFETLLPTLEEKYGVKAVQPLVEIAKSKQLEDTHRYIALMSATKMGGIAVLPMLKSLLKDRSWMMRSGALRAIQVLKLPEVATEVLPLLRDPALVVRIEAVSAVLALKPVGAADALIATLEDKENYHGKKAQWVPQRALLALAQLNAKEAIPKLQGILKNPEHQSDPEFLQQTRLALRQLSSH